MTLAIHRLLAGKPDHAALDAFVERHDFPLVEGRSVTFVYRGEADAVELRHWIYGLPSSQSFSRVNGSDFWFLVLELPANSRVEYKIDLIRGENHQWIRDPLNPNLAFDPFGANSVCYSAGYETPDWALPNPDARTGEIQELRVPSDAFGRRRRVMVYLPARFRPRRRYPLLVVHDGRDYLRYASLQTVLDNLIHRLEIEPLIAVLTQSPDRLTDYAADRRQARFLVEELVPYLEGRYPLRREAAARGVMGASFGGVATLSTAWYYPNFFGRLLLQSGSFAFNDIGDPSEHARGPVFEPVVEFVNAFRADPQKVTEKVFVSCGVYESLIYENRSLVPLLQATGMDVRYVEARDGHNWENWRDRLREGLSWLFPGPLWMVYE